jgi:glycerol kinase
MMNMGKNSSNRKRIVNHTGNRRQRKPCYALEGSIFIAGAAIQWLRDEMKMIEKSADSEGAGLAIADIERVYFVPAFVGLGTPYWDSEVRGIITGLTAERTAIILFGLLWNQWPTKLMMYYRRWKTETNLKIPKLFVDGGASANNFLMQFQADISDKPVLRPTNIESTSLGAAFLAGLKINYWQNIDELCSRKQYDRTFQPNINQTDRKLLIAGWQKALRQTMAR